jgi:hypothetical protein
MASSGMIRRVALMRTDVLEERNTSILRVTWRRLQEIYGITSQKTAFFIVTAVKPLKSYINAQNLKLGHPDDAGDTFLRNVGSYKRHAE